MGRSRPSRYSEEHAQLQAVSRARALDAQNAEVRRDEVQRRLVKALAHRWRRGTYPLAD